MAATAGHSLNIGPYGKMKKRISSDTGNRFNHINCYCIVIFFVFFVDQKAKLADIVYSYGNMNKN
jgi:hypothetical protein